MCSQTKKYGSSTSIVMDTNPFVSGPDLTSGLYRRPSWAQPWALVFISLSSVLSSAGLFYSFSTFPAVLTLPHSWATSRSFHNRHFYCIPLVEGLMILKALEILELKHKMDSIVHFSETAIRSSSRQVLRRAREPRRKGIKWPHKDT